MPHRPAPAFRVAPRLVAAALAALLVAGLTLAPRSIVGPARGAFLDAVWELAAPLVAGLTYTDVESALNALLFVRLGVALAALLPMRAWLLAPITGLLASVTVEYLQLRIPGRVPDVADILWNSVGALAGAVIVAVVRLLSRRQVAERATHSVR